MSTRGLKTLKLECIATAKEFFGGQLLLHQVESQYRDWLTKWCEDVTSEKSKKLLHSNLDLLKSQLKELRAQFHLLGRSEEFIRVADEFQSLEPGSVLLIPMWRIKELVDGTKTVKFKECRAHTMVEINVCDADRPGDFEVYLLEARLFENMSALFNLAFDRQTRASYPRADKLDIKTTIALELATVTTAFQCIEAYLNGLAFDFVKRMGTDNIAVDTLEILTEWDSKKNRARFVTFRDKLLKYPRIVAGVEHPLFQENNCIEIRTLLETARPLRDSITHASPFPMPDGELNKLSQIFQCRFRDVEQIVDAVVSVIRLIETAVFGTPQGPEWIFCRDPTGRFPDKAFK